jgi:hypothetical protein
MQHWPNFVAAPLPVLAPAAQATVYLSVEQAQQAIFPGGTFVPSDATLAPVRAWKVPGAGWLLVDQVIGKHELITYALGVDASGKVRGVEILEYRENYGQEIRSVAWRRQFTGKSAADPLRLEEDIQNISGATLSCRHVTEGIRRLLALYESSLKGR